MQSHFWHPGNPKKRNGRSSWRYVPYRRIALRNHNLLSGRLKMRIWIFRWSDV
jgi:hypothetical protein